jgi:hypothetical protein
MPEFPPQQIEVFQDPRLRIYSLLGRMMEYRIPQDQQWHDYNMLLNP